MSYQPESTGEWTTFGTSVKRIEDDDSLFHCSTQTDADVAIRTHNAALDAEHAKTLKWTEESADLSRQLAAEREKVKDAQDEAFAGEWTKDILDELSKRLPPGYHFGQLVADAHNAAIAEAQKPLMDALTRIRSESLSWTELQNIAAAALANVKEGK